MHDKTNLSTSIPCFPPLSDSRFMFHYTYDYLYSNQPIWPYLKIKITERNVSKEQVIFEFEKETKNSVRYKEVPEEGKAPIVGSLYLQKWFAGDAKNLQLTIELKK